MTRTPDPVSSTTRSRQAGSVRNATHPRPRDWSPAATLPVQLLLLAKQPVPGRVKTRLCPPCTPQQAAEIAAAALADTIDVVSATPAHARTLVVDGTWPVPAGWRSVPQRGEDLDERLESAFLDTRMPRIAGEIGGSRMKTRADAASLLVGMDTPQLTVDLLAQGIAALADADAALGLAEDGGWWALALRRPADARLLRGIATSTPQTGAQTLAALQAAGLHVRSLPVLRDVDTADDARAVARQIDSRRGSRFAAAVREIVQP